MLFKFEQFSKEAYMNVKTIIIFLLCATIYCDSFTMHKPANIPEIPVEIDNKSDAVVTIIFDALHCLEYGQIGLWRKFDIILPGQLYSKGIFDTPGGPYKPVITVGKDIRIVTTGGHFSLAVDASKNPPVTSFGLSTGNKWKLFEPISLAALTKITARVQPDGFVKLIQHKHTPQDGRPDVSLLAYEELLGVQEFASAEQILGMGLGDDPELPYRNQVATFNAKYSQLSQPREISALIFWAAKKLGVKNP